MPAPKPSTVADWDTSDLNLSMPSGGQIASGWLNNQVVPSNWLNWWMNLVGQWTDYLRDFEIQAHTWTVVQTLAAGAIAQEPLLLETPDQLTPALFHEPQVFATYSLYDKIQQNGSTVFGRSYTGTVSERVFTENCSWNEGSGLWTADSPGSRATFMSVAFTGITIKSKMATSSAWGDGAWEWVQTIGNSASSGHPGAEFQSLLPASRGAINLLPQSNAGSPGHGDFWVPNGGSDIGFKMTDNGGNTWPVAGRTSPVTGSNLNGASGTWKYYIDNTTQRVHVDGFVSNPSGTGDLVFGLLASSAYYPGAMGAGDYSCPTNIAGGGALATTRARVHVDTSGNMTLRDDGQGALAVHMAFSFPLFI